MALYRFRALRASGLVFEGETDVPNEAALARVLADQHAELIEAKKPSLPFFGKKQKQIPTSLADICRFLTDLLRAGLPFPEALRLVAAPLQASALGEALREAERALHQGARLSEAFASPLFKPTFRAALEAGEGAGDLAACFERLAQDLSAEDAFRRKLIKAARYPLFLVAVALGVMMFMLSLVVPNIVLFLKSFDQALPLSTRILIAAADAAPIICVTALGFILCAIPASIGLARVSKPCALFFDRILLRLPLLGPILRQTALLRFLRALYLLLQSGVHLPDAMATAAPSLNRISLIEETLAARKALLMGSSFSDAVTFLPPFALSMIRVGENAGNLPKALTDVLAHLERDCDAALDRSLAGIEPVLTLCVGGLLAWIVLAVLGPLYGSLGVLGGGG